jgi:hypothetical protein
VDQANTDVIQGTMDMLILKTLSLQPMHGYGIDRRIEQISRGVSRSIRDRCSRRFSDSSAQDGSMRSGSRPRTHGAPRFTR